MNKTVIFSIIGLLIIAAGAFLLLKPNEGGDNTQAELSSTPEEKRASVAQADTAIIESKLVLGEETAQATVVEYVDYKCPNCNRFHRTTAGELEEKYSDEQLNIEVRITPVIGPDSANAGRGAYCANEQGIFETYHDLVMDYMWDNYYSSGDFASEFEDILTTDKLAELMANQEIDIDSFKSCVNSDKFNPKLDENLLAAADDSIRGTPGFVINGQSFVGIQPTSVFITLIDGAL